VYCLASAAEFGFETARNLKPEDGIWWYNVKITRISWANKPKFLGLFVNEIDNVSYPMYVAY
jgi:hypothetical protein